MHHCHRPNPNFLCFACFLVSDLGGEPRVREMDTLIDGLYVVLDGEQERQRVRGEGEGGGRMGSTWNGMGWERGWKEEGGWDHRRDECDGMGWEGWDGRGWGGAGG